MKIDDLNLEIFESNVIKAYGQAWIIIIIFEHDKKILTERYILFQTDILKNMHESLFYNSITSSEAESTNSILNSQDNLKSAIYHHFILSLSKLKEEKYPVVNVNDITLTKSGNEKLLQLKQIFQSEIKYISKVTLCSSFSEYLDKIPKFSN